MTTNAVDQLEEIVERNAFIENIYRHYYIDLLRYCNQKIMNDSMMRSYIEDCIHDTFLAAIENYKTLLDHENIVGWLKKTLVNRLYNAKYHYYKYTNSFNCMSLDDTIIEIEDLSDAINNWHINENIKNHIISIYNNLNHRERILFHMVYFDGNSVQQIAKIWNMKPVSVRSQICKMRQRLRSEDSFS